MHIGMKVQNMLNELQKDFAHQIPLSLHLGNYRCGQPVNHRCKNNHLLALASHVGSLNAAQQRLLYGPALLGKCSVLREGFSNPLKASKPIFFQLKDNFF